LRAQVLYGPRDLRWEMRSNLEPGHSEVVVKVRAASICGSDIHRVMSKHTYSYPIILGHEFTGTVYSIGAGVENLIEGQPCTVVPLIPCRECEWCERGKYSLCDNYSYLGTRRNGAFAENVLVPAANIIPLPNNVDLEAAALIEPSSVVLHGMLRVRLHLGDTVAVIGLGPLGMLALQWARLLGATKIIAIDVIRDKLKMALKLGADIGLNSNKDIISRVYDETNGRGVDVVIESAGVPSVLELCLEMVRKQGKMLILGMPLTTVNINNHGCPN